MFCSIAILATHKFIYQYHHQDILVSFGYMKHQFEPNLEYPKLIKVGKMNNISYISLNFERVYAWHKLIQNSNTLKGAMNQFSVGDSVYTLSTVALGFPSLQKEVELPLVTTLLVGLCLVFFFFFLCSLWSTSLQYGIEDIALRWKNPSLMEAEGKNVDLTRDKSLDFVLAAKFFTRRSLSIEAVAKTFRLIW